MSIAIGDDHLELLATVRRFTADRCPPSVARAAMEADPAEPPPFWDELAKLGWLGLAVPEDLGGEGYGYVELAIVLEELGRVVAPGPMLTTAWVACLLSSGMAKDEPAVVELAKDLAAGRRTATVALGPPLDGTDVGDEFHVSGSTGPMLCGGTADVALVPYGRAGAEVEGWGVVDLWEAEATPLDSLDPTRPLADVRLPLTPITWVPMLTREKVMAVGVALTAAECAGGAAWCVDTAAEYARDRRQFGRPIGQFQGVKHRCANMLVAVEQARGVAWDAAAALDSDTDDAELRLAVAAAGAIAPDAFATVAKDC
ncbi:MAG: acyl-CoA dehydrogenase family protein, partial [Acidimicrobiales bacterium]